MLECEYYDVCIESTDKYLVPVFNLLEKVIHITIVNPEWGGQ
ncbi:hypothetical protein [Enterococcus gilvus]|nr:hypothetical protein [Enterococcus gilvus]